MAGELVEAVAERLVSAIQALLAITADLKRQTLLDNFPVLNGNVQQRRSQLEAFSGKAESAMKQIQEEMATSLQVHSFAAFLKV